jgi:hypothetical protein
MTDWGGVESGHVRNADAHEAGHSSGIGDDDGPKSGER